MPKTILKRKNINENVSVVKRPKTVSRERQGDAGKSLISEKNKVQNVLPPELWLKVFAYLDADSLLSAAKVCKRWQCNAMDWTVWRKLRSWEIGPGLSTAVCRNLINSCESLEEIRIFRRTDMDGLLKLDFSLKRNLRLLEVEHCSFYYKRAERVTRTLSLMLRSCPLFKVLIIKYTRFHSNVFYEALANNIKQLDHVSISCTTRREMFTFVNKLRRVCPTISFNPTTMAGCSEDKCFYWGSLLGLEVRLLPHTPYYIYHPFEIENINYI